MDARTNTLVEKVDRVSSRLGPLNTLVEKVVERVAPRVTAKACWAGNVTCRWQCDYTAWWCDAAGFYEAWGRRRLLAV
jgi:hypothetical protein